MRFRPRVLSETQDNSRGGKESLHSRVKGIVSAVVILGGIYILLGFVADYMVEQISPQTEAKWFAWTETVMEPTLPVPPDLQQVFDRLIADESLDDFPFRLILLPTEDINAFAMPGGLVAVTQGLYDTVLTPPGRALVLGHEIGHLQYRHGLQRLGRSILVAGLYSLVGIDSSSVLKRSQFLAELQFSRQQEAESDAFGLNLVYRVYGSTAGALEFFENLNALESDSNSVMDGRFGSFLRTHPLTRERLKHLQDTAAKLDSAD